MSFCFDVELLTTTLGYYVGELHLAAHRPALALQPRAESVDHSSFITDHGRTIDNRTAEPSRPGER
jgi:hypothetical protein